jgi:hypothetical protein
MAGSRLSFLRDLSLGLLAAAAHMGYCPLRILLLALGVHVFVRSRNSLTLPTLTTYSLIPFASDTAARLAGIGDPSKLSQG